MGYTLVTSFDDLFYQKMDRILKAQNANKIPYGCDCDRSAADRTMKYHMTLVHWAREHDQIYLPRIDRIHCSPFRLKAVGTGLDLYHIWRPVRLEKHLSAYSGIPKRSEI